MCNWNNSGKFAFKNYILAFTIVAAVQSCKKFVEISPPINPIVSETVFQSDNSAEGAVAGIYVEMMLQANGSNQFTASGITTFTGMSSDELQYFLTSTRDEFIRNQLTALNHSAISSFFWDRAYKYIYTANLCLDGLNKSTTLSQPVKKMLEGECKFIRAFSFFHLVNLFGDVPLTTSSDFRDNATLGRTNLDLVYQQIITDLRDARDLLPEEYWRGPRRIRPNKGAASALLARVYLYKQQWTAAESEATSVINSPIYELEPNLSKVFSDTLSHEAIWQLLPVSPNVHTWEGNLLIPGGTNGAAPGYFITDGLYNSFEAGDLRKVNWLASRIYNMDTFYYPFKYKIRSGAKPVTEYYMVLRLAEQFLIRAEALAQQNKLDEAKADLDFIRNRAGLPGTTAIDREELLTAIEQERRIELFTEWGHRWFDLKRTGHVNMVLGQLKPDTWQSTDVLWPIPNDQININPSLKQNPGY